MLFEEVFTAQVAPTTSPGLTGASPVMWQQAMHRVTWASAISAWDEEKISTSKGGTQIKSLCGIA